MNKNKSALMKKLTKQLAIGLPVVALSGFLPGTPGVFVSDASAGEYSAEAEHHEAKEAKSEAESKYSEAKSEAEAKKAKAEAEGESEY